MKLLMTCFVIVAASAFASHAIAQSDNRPCGPDSIVGPLRLLIPQGHSGANFRPSCRYHDNCYSTPGADRYQCDLKWLNQMLAACNCSRRPRACQRGARIMYRFVRKYGQEAFDEAQRESQPKQSSGN